MVGDRMETDVVGAVAAGLDACLVLTGVGRPRQLLEHEALPVALLSDVGGLVSDHPVARPRPATAADMDEVRALTAAPEAAAEWGPDDVWVIGENGLDATATVDVREEDAYLRAVATREELRRRGVGSIVAAAAVGSARRLGASRVWLLTEAAESFFSGLGFERVDRGSMPKWIEAGPGEGCPQTAVAMRRALTQ
jgi:N-acetylglutamate synthase-like GNAT family acetyltransferase